MYALYLGSTFVILPFPPLPHLHRDTPPHAANTGGTRRNPLTGYVILSAEKRNTPTVYIIPPLMQVCNSPIIFCTQFFHILAKNTRRKRAGARKQFIKTALFVHKKHEQGCICSKNRAILHWGNVYKTLPQLRRIISETQVLTCAPQLMQLTLLASARPARSLMW